MKCVQITESRILAEEQLAKFRKKSARWKKKLTEQLEADIATLRAAKKSLKDSNSARCYRLTKSLAEIELPVFDGGPPLLYAVFPEDGETLVDALILALVEKNELLRAGDLDEALHFPPNLAAHAEGRERTKPSPSDSSSEQRAENG